MEEDDGFLNRLRSRGQEVLTQVSAELGQNKRFMQAMAGAMRGKERVEEVVGRVVRQMNVPTRSELKRAVARIDALEKQLAALKRGRPKDAAGRARSGRSSSKRKSAE
jgi:hypothetical protein